MYTVCIEAKQIRFSFKSEREKATKPLKGKLFTLMVAVLLSHILMMVRNIL